MEAAAEGQVPVLVAGDVEAVGVGAVLVGVAADGAVESKDRLARYLPSRRWLRFRQ
jgi:hypothetical protein